MSSANKLLIASVMFLVISSLAACSATDPTAQDVTQEPWDYVVLGPSIGTRWAEYYGEMVETDLGVELRYHNYYEGAQTAEELLNNLKNDETLRERIREADIITIGIGFPDLFFGALREYRMTLLEPDELKQKMNNDQQQLEQKLKTFRVTYDALLDEILTLTSTNKALIRVMDTYFPFVAEYKRIGIYDQSKDYIREFNNHIEQSATERGIPVVYIFLLFNGPDGDEDPFEKGWIAADFQHPNETGLELIASEFRKLGYQYNEP